MATIVTRTLTGWRPIATRVEAMNYYYSNKKLLVTRSIDSGHCVAKKGRFLSMETGTEFPCGWPGPDRGSSHVPNEDHRGCG